MPHYTGSKHGGGLAIRAAGKEGSAQQGGALRSEAAGWAERLRRHGCGCALGRSLRAHARGPAPHQRRPALPPVRARVAAAHGARLGLRKRGDRQQAGKPCKASLARACGSPPPPSPPRAPRACTERQKGAPRSDAARAGRRRAPRARTLPPRRLQGTARGASPPPPCLRPARRAPRPAASAPHHRAAPRARLRHRERGWRALAARALRHTRPLPRKPARLGLARLA